MKEDRSGEFCQSNSFVKMQRTISKEVEFIGTGLHTGKRTRLVLRPAPPETGICFRRMDLPGKPEIPGRVEFFQPLPIMCSCLSHSNGARILLVEHLMACLNAFGIDNMIVELDNEEPPFEDGSAQFFVSMILDAGIAKQNAPDRIVEIRKPLILKEGDVELTAFPSDSLRVTFFASYPHPLVGVQSFSVEVTPENFMEEIAPARTFCFERDVENMMNQDLLQGATENSALVFLSSGLLKGSLQFPEEPARHKIMDLIGDLYLLGAALHAHVTAVKSGHNSHARFVKKIREEMKNDRT